MQTAVPGGDAALCSGGRGIGVGGVLVIRCKGFLVVVMESKAVVISLDPIWFPEIMSN